MSLARRRRLVELARERELIVLEDNPYGLLRYEGDALPTLRSLEVPPGSARRNDFVIYTGTMSKILSPGVRVGWLVAPRPLLAKLILGKQSRRPVLIIADPALRRRATSRRRLARICR